MPAAEAEAVGEDADGAEGHGGGGEPGREQDVEGGIEQAGGERNAEEVVADGPAEILAHDAESLAGEGERGGNGGGLGAQEEDIAGFLGEIGTGAHGDAGVGLGEGGGVVYAVANHGYAKAGLLEGADAGEFAGWIESGFNFGDSSLRAMGAAATCGVAGEHEDA